MLGQDVQAIFRTANLLDSAGRHLVGQHSLLQQVGRRLGNQPAFAFRPHQVAGSTDPLQRPGHVAGRLDLADQIDGPHVDAHFQRSGRHHRGQTAFLQRLLGLLSDLQGDAAVMGPGQLFLLVQLGGDAFHGPAVVGEDERRAMLPNLVGQEVVNRRPNALLGQGSEAIDGAEDAQIEIAADAGIDDGHRPGQELAVGAGHAAAEVAGHLVQGPLGGRQADAEEAGRVEGGQALQQQGQKDAAFVGAEGVDFIDDAMGDVTERVAGSGGEQQVQRFRRGDQDVRRPAQEALSFRGGGVAGPYCRSENGQRLAELAGHLSHAFQGHLEIAMDVVVEGLERRDIKNLDAAGRRILAPEAIETGQESRQGLAGSGGGENAGCAGRRRWPASRSAGPVWVGPGWSGTSRARPGERDRAGPC